MLKKIAQSLQKLPHKFKKAKIPVTWIRKNDYSWLSQQFIKDFIKPEKTAFSTKIENLAQDTNKLGPQPLWEGYASNNIAGSTRMPNNVRTSATMGNIYTYLVQKRQPSIIVEFGTAFGVSGMYFLAGLELNHKGKLLTFEPNEVWRNIAQKNLLQISEKFSSIAGTFEENIDNVLPQGESIDMAFIDAIHTKEFVMSQLEIVLARCSNKAIIILDDINFSDNMNECWQEISVDDRFSCSVELSKRVGILEVA
ncbi:O-methyltransferase [Nodularia sp. NIES-3585]|uniref:O-methyltransferase n=1 Tax=Nodularia sp. NIES-3585 TaxID=1973477 RepID=UPI000B5CF02F|nr:class I SAM-dependent methyltransferase [Nodularia sp. NIES-3585]GAX37792.1 O-methyltransferase-like protein [Nodularia sp. NIES-3585]